jgi:hypothetical protein
VAIQVHVVFSAFLGRTIERWVCLEYRWKDLPRYRDSCAGVHFLCVLNRVTRLGAW